MMPDRMVRDELLTSERYWGCSPEARNLFISILLSADDCARYTGSNFALRTKCMAGSIDSERLEKLLMELIDCDLVRAYQHENARYLFVPRFRQRLRFTKSKYPDPPIEINDLSENKSDSSQTQDGRKSDSSQTQDGRSEEKRREEKRSKSLAANEKISFSADGSWEGISESRLILWREAYPAINVTTELAAAAAWVLANPKNRKSNYGRFLTAWLKRAQDKAPRVATNGDSLLNKLRERYPDAVPDGNGYRDPPTDMRWDREGNRQVTI